MISFLWVSAIWAMVLAFGRARFVGEYGPTEPLRAALTREKLALVVLLAGTFSFVVRRGAADTLENPIVLETAIRGAAALIALLLVADRVFALFSTEGETHHRMSRGMAAVLVYTTVAVLSTLYSVAPLVTAGNAFELVVLAAIALAVFGGRDHERESLEAIRLVIILGTALLVVALIGFSVRLPLFVAVGGRPAFFGDYAMTSPYMHSNGLSALGGIFAGYWLTEAFRGVKTARWLTVLCVAAAIAASARQGVILLVISLGVALWVSKRQYLLLYLPLAALAWLFADTLFTPRARWRRSSGCRTETGPEQIGWR